LLAVDESAQAAMLRADKALYQAKVGPHADGPADVFTVGYACDKETPDLYQWSSQGLRGASAQMVAGGGAASL
jgi:hypothetical protein